MFEEINGSKFHLMMMMMMMMAILTVYVYCLFSCVKSSLECSSLKLYIGHLRNDCGIVGLLPAEPECVPYLFIVASLPWMAELFYVHDRLCLH